MLIATALLASLWPQAEHQLCVFHLMQDITDEVLEAVKRLRRQQKRRGNAGRKRARGGRKRSSAAPTASEKAHFVFKHRYLIVKRRDKLTRRQRHDLQTMGAYLPELRVLRQFMDRVYLLLAAAQTEEQAWQRYEQWCAEAAFRAVPELAAVVAGMTRAKFGKAVAFLRSPLGQRLRTNNHVERLNRQVRHYEAVRYGWRSSRGILRFVVVLLERCWQSRQASSGPRRCAPGSDAEPANAAAASIREAPTTAPGAVLGNRAG